MARCSKLVLIAALAIGSLMPLSSHAERLKRPVRGPKLICFIDSRSAHSSFDLLEGETITDFDGVEFLSVTVEGPAGRYKVGAYATYGHSGRDPPAFEINGLSGYREAENDGAMYRFVGAPDESKGQPTAILVLTGPALKGDERDRTIYSRLHQGHAAPCGYGFASGGF